MAPLSSSSNNNHSYYESMYAPEDKDQSLVVTPYGKGTVIRTRRRRHRNNENSNKKPKKDDDLNNGDDDATIMHEIELTDWIKPPTKKGPQKPNMLYSPTEFPSVTPKVGDDVKTMYGRGTVTAIRDDDGSLEVRISSWRLARRSIVTCYLNPKTTKIQVVRPHRIYEMNIWEKVEHAQKVKTDASQKFASKQYSEALELYAKAVDAVRYVQHKKDSSNELRADLLVVMITCCNNAATCCIQLQDWGRATKFGKHALVLLEALEEKQGNSKIHTLLNRDVGIDDSQLFGTWKVKSYIVIARGYAEKKDSQQALDYVKRGLESIAKYKVDGDKNYQLLVSQEKQLRKLHSACSQRIKMERKKEKQRAKAMFGGGGAGRKEQQSKQASSASTSTPSKAKNSNNSNKLEVSPTLTDSTAEASSDGDNDNENNETTNNRPRRQAPAAAGMTLKKQVSFADGSKPGDYTPSFWEEHKEAMIVVAGVAIGSAFVNYAFKALRRR